MNTLITVCENNVFTLAKDDDTFYLLWGERGVAVDDRATREQIVMWIEDDAHRHLCRKFEELDAGRS